jgi:hypothetical protein
MMEEQGSCNRDKKPLQEEVKNWVGNSSRFINIDGCSPLTWLRCFSLQGCFFLTPMVDIGGCLIFISTIVPNIPPSQKWF